MSSIFLFSWSEYSCSVDDGIWSDAKKGLVQHSGSKPICKYVRLKTKVSKTHINGKFILSDFKSGVGSNQCFYVTGNLSFHRMDVWWYQSRNQGINLLHQKFQSHRIKSWFAVRWHDLEQAIWVMLIDLESWFHH